MEHIIYLLIQYKYFWLLPLAVVEGPILAVIAGLLCSGGYLNPLLVFPIIILGDLTGDSLCYLLGRRGMPRILQKLGNRLGLDRQRLDSMTLIFERNPSRTISLSKIVLGIGVAGIYLAGHAKIPYRQFIRICAFTSSLQYLFYLGIGIVFGHAYMEINHYLNMFATVSILVVLAILLFLFFQSKLKKV